MKERAVDRFRAEAEARWLGELDVREFPEGTKTASDAARAIGCEVGQIVKSVVLMADGRPIVALTSGANRADTRKIAAIVGAAEVRKADATEAREATGFAIGGTPPMGYPAAVPTFIDDTLMQHDELWAAAGTPYHVFRITPEELVQASGGVVASFARQQ